MAELKNIPYDSKIVANMLLDDGMLMDIFILHSSLKDWNHILEGLRNSNYELEFLMDAEPAKLPKTAEEIFGSDTSNVLKVKQDNIYFHAFFYMDNEIDFDISPGAFQAYQEVDDLFSFMRFLSKTTGKPCLLSRERDQENVLMKVYPDTTEIQIVSGA